MSDEKIVSGWEKLARELGQLQSAVLDENAALRAQVAVLIGERDEAREGAASWRSTANRDASQVAALWAALERIRELGRPYPEGWSEWEDENSTEAAIRRQEACGAIARAALEMIGGVK
jgi:hypothetical protein